MKKTSSHLLVVILLFCGCGGGGGGTSGSGSGPTLVSIAVTPINPTIAVSDGQQFTATGTYSNSSTRDITSSVVWSSSNGVATINNAGLANAAAGGSTSIKATSGSISGSTTLTIVELVSIAVNPANPIIPISGIQYFTATGTYSDSSTRNITSSVVWSSSSGVATINSAGLATSTAAGSTTIKAASGSISGSTILTIAGASGNRLRWTYITNRPIYYSSPAIGPSGTIYVGNGALSGNVGVGFYPGIYAINPDGTLKWEFDSSPNPYAMFTPSIGTDETVYVQDASSSLYALSTTNGTLKWKYALNVTSTVGQTAPAIGPDGTIYIGAKSMYAINPDGTLKWSYTFPGTSLQYIRTSPAIAPDGTIYFGASGGTGVQRGFFIIALNSDGTLKWNVTLEKTNDFIFSSPAIGGDGTIYFGTETWNDNNSVFALNPDGTQKWRYEITGGGPFRSSPAIGPDGTVYIGKKAGPDVNAAFLALNPNGTLKWKFEVLTPMADIYCSPAVGADGIIYVGSEDGYLYALNPDGTLAWAYLTNNGINWTSPAIDNNGTIYIGNNNGELFALNSSSLGLANSPWPKFRHDNRNTGKYAP